MSIKESPKWPLVILLAGIAAVSFWFFESKPTDFSSFPPESIPEHLKLKVPKERIKENIRKGDIVQYAYQSNIPVDDSIPAVLEQYTSLGVLKKLETPKVVVTNEDVSKRTYSSRTFKTNQPGRFIVHITSGASYDKDENGIWWNVEYATTSFDAFNQQVLTFWERFQAKIGLQTANATSGTFYPSGDGSVQELYPDNGSCDTKDWTTIREAAGNNNANGDSNGSFIRIQTSLTSNRYCGLYRAGFIFDTTSIPAGSTINTATMNLIGIQKQNDSGASVVTDINVYSFAPAGTSSVVNGDYDACGTTAYSTAISYASFNDAGNNAFSLNASGKTDVIAGGYSKFCTRNATHDAPNSEPTWISDDNNMLNGYFVEQAGTGNDPNLVVDYTESVSVKKQSEIFFND